MNLPDIAPINASYHGMNPDYLTKCDRLFDLTQEICQEEIKERPKAQRTKLEPKPKRPKLDTSPVDVAGPSNT